MRLVLYVSVFVILGLIAGAWVAYRYGNTLFALSERFTADSAPVTAAATTTTTTTAAASPPDPPPAPAVPSPATAPAPPSPPAPANAAAAAAAYSDTDTDSEDEGSECMDDAQVLGGSMYEGAMFCQPPVQDCWHDRRRSSRHKKRFSGPGCADDADADVPLAAGALAGAPIVADAACATKHNVKDDRRAATAKEAKAVQAYVATSASSPACHASASGKGLDIGWPLDDEEGSGSGSGSGSGRSEVTTGHQSKVCFERADLLSRLQAIANDVNQFRQFILML
jgi:hypothetical protein